MKKYLILVIVILILGGCCCGPQPFERYYHSVVVPPIYKDDNNKLYFVDQSNQNLYEFYDINKTWVKIATKKNDNIKLISNEYNTSFAHYLYDTFDLVGSKTLDINATAYIKYYNNTAIIKNKDTNETLFTQILPTINDIINVLNLSTTSEYIIDYLPFFTKQYNWDKKRHLMSIATNKSKINSNGETYEVYYISLLKENDTWKIQLINTIHDAYNISADWNNLGSIQPVSLDAKVSIRASCIDKKTCEKTYYFILEEDNQIYLKSLFDDIYNKEYKTMLDNIYQNNVNAAYNYTFDEQGNMHLFYNKREDIVSGNYDYFWYGYFTRENPTTPLYEQKIPWEM